MELGGSSGGYIFGFNIILEHYCDGPKAGPPSAVGGVHYYEGLSRLPSTGYEGDGSNLQD